MSKKNNFTVVKVAVQKKDNVTVAAIPDPTNISPENASADQSKIDTNRTTTLRRELKSLAEENEKEEKMYKYRPITVIDLLIGCL